MGFMHLYDAYMLTVHAVDKETVGAALKQFRIERDMKVFQVAAAIGVTASTVSRIERGKTKPNDRTLYKILKAFPTIAA